MMGAGWRRLVAAQVAPRRRGAAETLPGLDVARKRGDSITDHRRPDAPGAVRTFAPPHGLARPRVPPCRGSLQRSIRSSGRELHPRPSVFPQAAAASLAPLTGGPGQNRLRDRAASSPERSLTSRKRRIVGRCVSSENLLIRGPLTAPAWVSASFAGVCRPAGHFL
jgi:hypothetical protein